MLPVGRSADSAWFSFGYHAARSALSPGLQRVDRPRAYTHMIIISILTTPIMCCTSFIHCSDRRRSARL